MARSFRWEAVNHFYTQNMVCHVICNLRVFSARIVIDRDWQIAGKNFHEIANSDTNF